MGTSNRKGNNDQIVQLHDIDFIILFSFTHHQEFFEPYKEEFLVYGI